SAVIVGSSFRAVVIRVVGAETIDLLLCGDEHPALTTADHPGKGELVDLGLSLVPVFDMRLHPFELFDRNYLFVSTGIDLACPGNETGIEGIAQHLVDPAQRNGLPTKALAKRCAEPPLFVCHLSNILDRSSCERLIEHLSYNGKPFCVFHNRSSN